MIKQRWLAFLEREGLELLWEQFPAEARDEVTQQYARLMARTSVERIRALRKDHTNREVNDESDDQKNNG